jgi:phosphatidylglycerophosphate synthase
VRRSADTLTAFRALCGVFLAFRPSWLAFFAGVLSDWLDGPLARRAGVTAAGARFDLEADSLLTLGAAIAAVRCGAPRIVLVAPVARYAVQALRPRLTPDEARWDRITGVAQMAVLGAAIARWPFAALALPMSAARAAALAARVAPRGRLHLAAQPAEPR